MRMSDVEAQGIRTAFGDQHWLAVRTPAELHVTRVHVEVAPKNRPQHRSTSSEMVAVSLKIKPRGALLLLLRQDAIDLACGEPRVVQIRKPYIDLIMVQSDGRIDSNRPGERPPDGLSYHDKSSTIAPAVARRPEREWSCGVRRKASSKHVLNSSAVTWTSSRM